MEQIRHINRCNTLQDRAVLTDGSFCVPCLMETGIMKTRSERKAYTAIDRPENYRAKLANASFRTARPGPPGFAEKSSSPGGLAVFFPKALPFRKRLP
ncbi:hypothetical protein O1400_01195 [Bacteroides fragilis]|uniref:hypothetical protein n=1 Tax=Bacteroidales TaxID=171549 RepID=UPI0013153F50|nr:MULTISPECIES: hypothetical protein [Bacteroidales]MCZ2600972.1 hypothetical protein [Bacteroides fragilis]